MGSEKPKIELELGLCSTDLGQGDSTQVMRRETGRDENNGCMEGSTSTAGCRHARSKTSTSWLLSEGELAGRFR